MGPGATESTQAIEATGPATMAAITVVADGTAQRLPCSPPCGLSCKPLWKAAVMILSGRAAILRVLTVHVG